MPLVNAVSDTVREDVAGESGLLPVLLRKRRLEFRSSAHASIVLPLPVGK